MKTRAIRWNDTIDEYIVRKRLAGASYRSIAAAIGCSKTGVWARFLWLRGDIHSWRDAA